MGLERRNDAETRHFPAILCLYLLLSSTIRLITRYVLAPLILSRTNFRLYELALKLTKHLLVVVMIMITVCEPGAVRHFVIIAHNLEASGGNHCEWIVLSISIVGRVGGCLKIADGVRKKK